MASPADALFEIDALEDECIKILLDVDKFSPADQNGKRPDIFRLIAVPLIYSVWERAFRVSSAIAIRFVIENSPSTNELPAAQRALLLQKEKFFKSYIDKLGAVKINKEKGPGKGEFANLESVLISLNEWAGRKPRLTGDAESYVMTFSNVDEKVLRLHEHILATGETLEIGTESPLDISLLGALLGRRNDISHGGSMQPPGDRNLNEFFSFTETLISSYCESMRKAIRASAFSQSRISRFKERMSRKVPRKIEFRINIRRTSPP